MNASDDSREAGWKSDPKGNFDSRFWDGEQWTDRVLEGDVEALDPIKNTMMVKHPEPGSKRYASLVKGHERLARLHARSGNLAQQRTDAKDAAAAELGPRQQEIEALASAKLDMRLGVGREVKALAEHLYENEQLITMARGGLNKAAGIVVVTDQRVVFLDKRLVGHHFEDFPMKAITSISASQAFVSAKVRIYAGSHSSEITDVIPKERGQEIVEAVRSAQAGSAPSASVTARSASLLDQLEQLGRLRDAGVLSQDEFDAQKAKLLG